MNYSFDEAQAPDRHTTQYFEIGGNRAISISVNANNLFNTIQWTSIDTNINSQTFGQVTRIGSMRTFTISARLRF